MSERLERVHRLCAQMASLTPIRQRPGVTLPDPAGLIEVLRGGEAHVANGRIGTF